MKKRPSKLKTQKSNSDELKSSINSDMYSDSDYTESSMTETQTG